MGYNLNTPGAQEGLAISQRKLRSNSFRLDEIFEVDHYKFSEEDDLRGRHRQTKLPLQGSAPTVAADELGVYSREDGGDNFISIKYPSGDIYNLLDESPNAVIANGSLRLGAYATFDKNGNFINDNKFNISSIITNPVDSGGSILLNDITINFTSSLPTDDYFIDLAFFQQKLQGFSYSIDNDATYSNSVTDSMLKLRSVTSLSIQPVYNFKVWYLI
jgi:hypothetical protein